MDPRELAALLGYTDYEDQVTAPEAGVYTEPTAAAPLGAVGQPGNTYSAWGAPESDYSPDATPLTPEQGFAVLPPVQKAGVSTSGYSPEKQRQIDRGPVSQKRTTNKIDTERKKIADTYAPMQADLEFANRQALLAEQAMGNAEAEKITAEGRQQLKVQKLYTDHQAEFAAINESTLIAKQRAMDEYRARLMEIPEVNPNALWDEAGSFGQFQMAVAAFTHDFLGAKGIKTSAMDTINNAIRNKIDSQIANINTKKHVAEGFKTLYDMTVQESASQMEVQAKMQGYMLKAMESGVKAELGKYDSNIARVKSQQAIAGLRQLQIKNMMEVQKHIDNAQHQRASELIQMRGQDLQYAQAKESLNFAREKAGLDAKAAKYSTPVIFDQSKSGQGRPVGRLRPEYVEDKTLVRELTQKVNATTNAVEAIRELNEIQAKIDGGGAPDVLGRLRKERDRLERAARHDVVWALTVDSAGKRASNDDVKKWEERIPVKDWFTNGDNRRILAQTIKTKIKETEVALGQYTNAVSAEDPAYNTRANVSGFAGSEKLDAELTINPPDAPETEKLLKEARSPGAMQPMSAGESFSLGGVISKAGSDLPKNSSLSVSKSVEHKQYTEPYWNDFKQKAPHVKAQSTVMGGMSITSEAPPVIFDRIREVAEDAFAGDELARKELESLKNSANIGGNQEALKLMAEYFLERIDLNPYVPGQDLKVKGFGIETD